MKKILIFVLCLILTAVAVYISGFPNLVNDVSPSLAAASFFGVSLLLTAIIFTIVTMYLKIKHLSDRLAKLEEKQK